MKLEKRENIWSNVKIPIKMKIVDDDDGDGNGIIYLIYSSSRFACHFLFNTQIFVHYFHTMATHTQYHQMHTIDMNENDRERNRNENYT